MVNTLSIVDGRQVSLQPVKVPSTIDFTPKKEGLWHMHPVRYEQDYHLQVYSYFDDGIYSISEWGIIIQSRLLPKNFRENINDYLGRLLNTAMWNRESSAVVQKLVGKLYQTRPTRAAQKQVLEWTRDVDGLGTDLDTYSRRSEKQALIYGSSYSLIMMTTPDNFSELSYDEQTNAMKPKLINFNALYIIDWKLDGAQQLNSCTFVKSDVNEKGDRLWRWYVVDKTHYRIYEKITQPMDANDPVLIEEIAHPFGCVPVVVHYGLEPFQRMMGVSFIRDTVEMDIAKLRRDSAILNCADKSAYNQLLVFTNEERFGEIKNSDDGYILLKPSSGEEMKYLPFSDAPITTNKEISDGLKSDIRTTLGVSPAENQTGKLAVSGISRQLDWAMSEKQILTSLAQRISEFEESLLCMVSWMIFNEVDENISVEYPNDFSPSSVDAVMAVYKEYKDIIPKEITAWHQHMMSEICKASVGDIPQVEEEINNQLEAYFKDLAEKIKNGTAEPEEPEEVEQLEEPATGEAENTEIPKDTD